jgi:hypothetical protein
MHGFLREATHREITVQCAKLRLWDLAQSPSGLGKVNPDSITIALTQDDLVGLAPTILESM